MTFQRIAVIGLGLLGGSIGLAVARYLPDATTTGYDRDRRDCLVAVVSAAGGRVTL